MWVGTIGILVITLIIAGFFFIGESRYFIECFANNSSDFLKKKLRINILFLVLFLLPIVILCVVFQPEIWYFTLGSLVLCCLMLGLSIIIKYGLFRENSDLSRNGLIFLITFICLLLPFLWPVPVIMGVRYYVKAKKKLNIYYDDAD
jgi:H+/Cl- antiporter ClcA